MFQAYLRAASLSVTSKLIAIVAQIAILWLSAYILDKSDFGVFMVALAITSLVGLLIPGPFCSVILYHASRLNEGVEEMDLGQDMTSRALIWVTAYAALTSLILGIAAPILEQLFAFENLALWIWLLLPTIWLEGLRRVLAVWHRARQDVKISITYNEIWPNVLKGVLLGAAALALPTREGIALALNAALLIPVIAIYKLQPVPFRMRGKIFTDWDIQYGAKNLLTYGLNQQSRGFDLILVGALSTSLVAADYAIAQRLGRFLLIGKQGLSQLLAPRLGAFLGAQNADTARLEFQLTRFAGYAVAVLGSLCVLVLGNWVVSLFCASCSSATPILLILCAAFVINTSFGSLEDYLTMAGHAGWNLSVSVLSTGLMIGLCALLIPDMGGVGAAWAVLIAFFVRGIGMHETVKRLDGVTLLQWRQIISAVFVAGILCAAAYDYMGHGIAFILILLTLGYGAAGARSSVRGRGNLI